MDQLRESHPTDTIETPQGTIHLHINNINTNTNTNTNVPPLFQHISQKAE